MLRKGLNILIHLLSIFSLSVSHLLKTFWQSCIVSKTQLLSSFYYERKKIFFIFMAVVTAQQHFSGVWVPRNLKCSVTRWIGLFFAKFLRFFWPKLVPTQLAKVAIFLATFSNKKIAIRFKK